MRTVSAPSLLVVIAASGCGGGTSHTADAGRPVDAAAARDVVAMVDTGLVSGCPTSMPAAGAPCSEPTLSCEYGSDPEISCDTVMTCETDGWKKTQTPAASGCGTTNPASCPATYADVSGAMGQSCGPAMSCYYPDARCTCEQVCLGACAQPADGGPAPLSWYCDVSAMTCPLPRPRLGSACTTDSLACDYGGCKGNITLQCQGGTWLAIQLGCPH